MGKRLRIISRQSRLALLQVDELKGLLPQYDYELITVDSYGDRHKDVSLMEPSLAADFFTRELDEALLDGRADIAVHSAKDLPYPLPAGLEVIALTEGGVKSDSLVSRGNKRLLDLPPGSRIGTSSAQRRAELLSLRPNVEVVPIRGTIEERIAQVDKGYIDALIVATCALDRLGLRERAAEQLPFKTHPLQGNLAVTARKDSTSRVLFQEIDVRRSYGKVTLVGFGPGDPELLTIKGHKALERAEVIYYDDLTNERYLESFGGEKVYVGKRSGHHSHHQDDINELIYQSAISGKSVVRLKGGDPMIFAHGREEVDYLRSRFVEVEVIPGISSGCALASLLQIPLTHRGVARSVAFALGHSSEPQTPDADTLLYYMGGAKVSQIARQLLEAGRAADTPAALVTNVSLPNQHAIYTTLGEMRWAVYRDTPVLIIVGETVRFEAQNVVQRTYNTGTQSDTPLITIMPTQNKISEQQSFDWVIFTSRYGVRYFDQQLKDAKIASVGPVTTDALRAKGIVPNFESATQSAEGILQHFSKLPPSRILLPRSDKGMKALSDGLAAQGHNVTDLAVYTNTPNADAIKQDLTQYDKIIFTSPSTVEAFKRLYAGEDTTHLLLIAKGKTTYEALQTI